MKDSDSILLGDVGGTNARFAILSRGAIGPVDYIRVNECSGLIEAIKRYLGGRERIPIKRAVLGLAGAVENDRCVIINSGWVADGRMLQEAFGFREVRLLNDFEALAWSLPHLGAADLFSLGGGPPLPRKPILLIGPGTGFGTSCLLARDGVPPVVIASEAGHSTLPGASRREDEIIELLRERFGHVSIERAVSGPGLVNLYEALAAIKGAAPPKRDGASITESALNNSCSFSRSAFDMFCRMLGTVAASLALAFCARGGIYLAGGIVPRFPEYLARSEFRVRFEAGGRYHAYLHDIPINIILRPDATFLGLKAWIAESPTTIAAAVPNGPIPS